MKLTFLARQARPLRSFRANLTPMAFGYKAKPNFAVDNEKDTARPPKGDFGSPLATPQPEVQDTAK